MDDQQLTLRDMVRAVTPSWLQARNSYKLMYAFGLTLDALLDASFAAVRHSFPGLYSYESLPLIGKESRLFRGLFESDEGYAMRLRRGVDANRRRGSVYELLVELWSYHAGSGGGSGPDEAFVANVIYRNGRRFTLPATQVGGASIRSSDEAANAIYYDDIAGWEPDTTPERWARQSILIITNAYHAVPEDHPEILARALSDLRSLIGSFVGAHMQHTEVIVLGDSSQLWDALPGTGESWDAPSGSTEAWDAPAGVPDIRFFVEGAFS